MDFAVRDYRHLSIEQQAAAAKILSRACHAPERVMAQPANRTLVVLAGDAPLAVLVHRGNYLSRIASRQSRDLAAFKAVQGHGPVHELLYHFLHGLEGDEFRHGVQSQAGRKFFERRVTPLAVLEKTSGKMKYWRIKPGVRDAYRPALRIV